MPRKCAPIFSYWLTSNREGLELQEEYRLSLIICRLRTHWYDSPKVLTCFQNVTGRSFHLHWRCPEVQGRNMWLPCVSEGLLKTSGRHFQKAFSPGDLWQDLLGRHILIKPEVPMRNLLGASKKFSEHHWTWAEGTFSCVQSLTRASVNLRILSTGSVFCGREDRFS